MEQQPAEHQRADLPSSADYKPNRLLQTGAYLVAITAGIALATNRSWEEHYSKFKKGFGGKELNDQRQCVRDAVRRVMLDPNIPSNATSAECWNQVFEIVKEKLPHADLSYITQRASNLDELRASLEKIDISASTLKAAHGVEISNQKSIHVTKTVEDWYNKNRKAIERAFGLETEGWKGHTIGLFQRFSDLSRPKQFSIMLSTAVSIGTVIGAYMLINQNMRMKNVTEQQDANLRELAARIDAAEKRRSEQYEQGAVVR